MPEHLSPLRDPQPGAERVSPLHGYRGERQTGTAPFVPAALTVELTEAALYARSEEWADKLTQLSRGEKLVPMVQATSANALWYMVKTETGVVGWIKASDVAADSGHK